MYVCVCSMAFDAMHSLMTMGDSNEWRRQTSTINAMLFAGKKERKLFPRTPKTGSTISAKVPDHGIGSRICSSGSKRTTFDEQQQDDDVNFVDDENDSEKKINNEHKHRRQNSSILRCTAQAHTHRERVGENAGER